MGTNFYAHEGVCPTCHRSDKSLHIGKRSGGWKFTWAGHRDRVPAIVSVDDWVRVLLQPGVEIRDEYEKPISTSEFFGMVDTWNKNPINKQDHYHYVQSDVERGDTWIDPAGNIFLGRAFE